jgi:hypothetical protein
MTSQIPAEGQDPDIENEDVTALATPGAEALPTGGEESKDSLSD